MNRSVIAHHLIFTSYGTWLPNDPRGSSSAIIRQPKFAPLGPIRSRQCTPPPRFELKHFYQQANPRLEFRPIWFDDSVRQTIAAAFSKVIKSRKYTIWACAIVSNHTHLLIRRHRDDDLTMWHTLAETAAAALRPTLAVPAQHPIWAHHPYSIFKYTPGQVRRCVDYIHENPSSDGLPLQHWPFVRPYNNWPFHKKTSPPPRSK